MPKRPILENIFLSPDAIRLRAGWRLAGHTLLFLAFLIFASLPFIILFFMDIEISDTLLLAVNHIAQFIATILSIFIARRFLDQRSFTSLGLKLDKKMWIDLFVGIVITFIQMGFIYIIMYALGWISFEGFAWEFESASSVTLNLLGIFGVFILVGWNEELLSRGYHLQNLADGINLTWGVIISSSVFAILHIGNPGATWISTLGLFLAGVFLAYGYIRTKQLWLPIGLHIGWNFFEGVVFGFPVSGLNIFTLTRINIHGPELITGGAFGPEAGLIVIPALVFGMALIYTYSNVGNARSVTPQP